LLFAPTIRRKMVFGLALVLVMLMTLSLSGLSGLISYRDTVRDLDISINQVPRRSELTAAIASLTAPLVNLQPSYRQSEFSKQLESVRQRVREFRRKLDALPPKPAVTAQRPITEQLLRGMVKRLDELENPQTRKAGTDLMLRELAHLQVLVHQFPDAQIGLSDTLHHAERAYHTRLWWVCGTSAVGVLLFFGLLRYGYTGIFAPLRKLHQGACRVAQGDFDYRLELTTNDEMAELAESFNRMTDRFQEIACNLDLKVRQRSKQLVRSERLAGIGFLAAGVAHEINNPLSVIAMTAESIQNRLSEMPHQPDRDDNDVVVNEYLDMIQNEAFRCQEITDKLLEFARGEPAQRGPNDLAQIVSDVLSMLQPLSRFRDRNIEFSRRDPCPVEINGPEIKQVVLNLVANSLEAMEPGGTLRIDILQQVDQVVLTFQDDGCGMTDEVIEHLFEPFFTRRKDGKGTGLGMAISHRIINDHGGTIEATSDGPNRGSTFGIYLPRRATISDTAA